MPSGAISSCWPTSRSTAPGAQQRHRGVEIVRAERVEVAPGDSVGGASSRAPQSTRRQYRAGAHDDASASWGAASACCPGCGGCGCRCRGPASRTATPGRSPPASGIVLVDTGMHEPGSMAQLERAHGPGRPARRARAAARLHARPLRPLGPGGADPSSAPAASCGCTPTTSTRPQRPDDPEQALARRIEVARQSGVLGGRARAATPSGPASMPSGIARVIEPDRALVDGVEIETDLGAGRSYETPGHAPSHVCLFQPERRLLISGDHLLGRISLYFDYGWTPDPVGEFLSSLDVVDALGRAAVPVGPRQAVRRRPRAHRGQPQARRRAARRPTLRRARRRAADGGRDQPERLRRASDASTTPPGC